MPMFKKSHEDTEGLDRLGRLILQAAVRNEAETEAAADAPFLFTRVRARIAAEQRRQREEGAWFSLPFVARRAIPAMALVALLTAGVTLWPSSSDVQAGWYRLDDEALSDTRNPGVEQTVLSQNTLSHDEIFDLVLERNDSEKR